MKKKINHIEVIKALDIIQDFNSLNFDDVLSYMRKNNIYINPLFIENYDLFRFVGLKNSQLLICAMDKDLKIK